MVQRRLVALLIQAALLVTTFVVVVVLMPASFYGHTMLARRIAGMHMVTAAADQRMHKHGEGGQDGWEFRHGAYQRRWTVGCENLACTNS